MRRLAVARLVLRLHRAARFVGPPSAPHQRGYGPEFVTRRIAVVAARPCGTPVGHDTGLPFEPSGVRLRGRTGDGPQRADRLSGKGEPIPPPGRRLSRDRLGRSISDRSPARNSPAKIPLKAPPNTPSKAPSNRFRKAHQKARHRRDFASADFALRGTGRGPPGGSAEAASGSTTAETTTPAITIMRRFMAAPPVDRAGIPDGAPKISTKSGRRGGAHPFNAETRPAHTRTSRRAALRPRSTPPVSADRRPVQLSVREPAAAVGSAVARFDQGVQDRFHPGSQGVTGPGVEPVPSAPAPYPPRTGEGRDSPPRRGNAANWAPSPWRATARRAVRGCRERPAATTASVSPPPDRAASPCGRARSAPGRRPWPAG